MKISPIRRRLQFRLELPLVTRLIFSISVLLCSLTLNAQTYQFNGSAISPGAGVVRLTASGFAGAGGQAGSAWCTTKIDLTQPFDKSFDMFFGCDHGAFGGDGMTFTFQNAGITALGEDKGYLGIGGTGAISPAVSIEFDTYDGTADGGGNEIVADHIAIDINGDVNHLVNDAVFTGTSGLPNTTHVQAIRAGRDLEDCAQSAAAFYNIRVVWTPAAHTLQLYENGVLTMTYTNDIVANVFGGSSSVYWGFTGATFTAKNEQWIAPSGIIIPWECAASNSCCSAFPVTPTGVTSICSSPVVVGVSGTYNDYDWSTGATTSTTSISTPGTYTIRVIQNQAGINCPGDTTFTIAAGGASSVVSGNATLCNDGTTTSPVSIALSGTPPWSLTYAIDGVTQTPAITGIATSPYTINGKSQHTYTVAALSDASGCTTSSRTGSAVLTATTGLPVGHDSAFVNPGSTMLKVDNGGGTYNWYSDAAGTALVGTGTSFTTPVLNATTFYYVKNTSLTAFSTKTVGLPGPGTGGSGTNPDDAKVNFLANSSFTFTSVTCAVNVILPWVNTTLSVSVEDVTTPALSSTVNIPYTSAPGAAGLLNISVPLNYSIISGHNYRLSYRGGPANGNGAQGNLQAMNFWNYASGANAFPITAKPEVTITGYLAPAQPESYPGLFNWIISVGSPAASCALTPVKAYPVTSLPVTFINFNATLQSSGVVLLEWSTALEINNSHFVVQRSTDGIHFTDIANVKGAGSSRSVRHYSANDQIYGTAVYYYRIKQVDFDKNYEYTDIRSVNSNDENFRCNIFPNPSEHGNQILITLTGAQPNENVPIVIYDILGRLLYSGKITCDERGNISSDIVYFQSVSQPGTYIISVLPSALTPINQKIVIM